MAENKRLDRLKTHRASCRLERDRWGALLIEYRRVTAPDHTTSWSHAGVGKACGVDPRTAQRAFEVGWLAPPWAARTIKDVINDERLQARATLAEADDRLKDKDAAPRLRTERELAKMDAAAEAVREAQAVRHTISTSLQLLFNLGALSGAATSVAQDVSRQMKALVASGKLAPDDGMRFLQQFSKLAKQGTAQLEAAMRMLRKHLGVPDALIGLVTPNGPTTLVDGRAAVANLGEDVLRQAVMDLAQGNMTDAVDQLFSFQVDRADMQAKAGVRPTPPPN